jgi:hypothetical protein
MPKSELDALKSMARDMSLGYTILARRIIKSKLASEREYRNENIR